jgi:hypothetical protein
MARSPLPTPQRPALIANVLWIASMAFFEQLEKTATVFRMSTNKNGRIAAPAFA